MNSLDLKELIEKNKDELFSEISDEIDNEKITDIEWDGYNLWITELGIGSYISGKELSDKYVENISIKLANIMGVQFNRSRPILEANTENLRISIWHESRCQKKSMSIRKIPEYLRFDHMTLIESRYAPESIINLLENSVSAHLSIVVGGQPHAGKTELVKYLTTKIPHNEKAGVYEAFTQCDRHCGHCQGLRRGHRYGGRRFRGQQGRRRCAGQGREGVRAPQPGHHAPG